MIIRFFWLKTILKQALFAREQGGGLDGTADVGRREVSTPSLLGAWACDNVKACAKRIVWNATGCAGRAGDVPCQRATPGDASRSQVEHGPAPPFCSRP